MFDNKNILDIAISKGKIPRYLYKFRTQSQLMQILQESTLYFSSPANFNDPFDCQISVDATNTIEEIAKYLENFEKDDEERFKLANELYNTPESWSNLINKVASQSINMQGVCSFAKDYQNILMWSHYTQSHTGVCLKFDLTADLDFFHYPSKVIYQKNYPFYNHITSKAKMLDTLMLTKAIDWEYEQEYRIIKMTDIGPKVFKKEALTEIIFGCRCEIEYIEKIIETVKQLDYNIVVKQAFVSKYEYKLLFKPITIGHHI